MHRTTMQPRARPAMLQAAMVTLNLAMLIRI
jgi:hypothetical protein